MLFGYIVKDIKEIYNKGYKKNYMVNSINGIYDKLYKNNIQLRG